MESRAYYLNQEGTVARFYTTQSSYDKKLSPTEYFSCNCFIAEGLCFTGKINLEKFLNAMDDTLQDFNFLFLQLYRSKEDPHSCYSFKMDNKHFIELEIEKKEMLINTSTLSCIVPEKVDQRIKNVKTDQLEGLPMGTFKLTIFLDGFAIGSYLNHAFFDQSSMFYFYKYLSHVYSYGKDNILLKMPNIVNLDYLSVNVEPPEVFKTVTDFRKHSGNFMAFKHISSDIDNTSSIKSDERDPKREETVSLFFSSNGINKLKSTIAQFISANDVIHATLLKIYSFGFDSSLDKDFSLGFVCNMRKHCGFGEEAIGNILYHPLMTLKLEDVKAKTIPELALTSREHVSKITVDSFRQSLLWYKYYHKYNELGVHYAQKTAIASNWSSFDYKSIIFDSAIPYELKAPCLASFQVNVISFYDKENDKILRTSISIPSNKLKLLEELKNTTDNLFSYELLNTNKSS